MRNNQFLEKKLRLIWNQYFADVPKDNMVEICFGRKCRKRMGSIKKRPCPVYEDRFHTLITINGHFKDLLIPEFVLEATIAHELCHYTHGFGSPLPQCFIHPHRNDVVDNELRKRGLGHLSKKEIGWLKKNWSGYLQESK